jgi:hypothetical protein
VRQPQRPPVRPVHDGLDAVQGACGEEREQALAVERRAVRQPQHERAGRGWHRSPAAAGLRAQRGRRHPVDLAHSVVELPDAGEAGRERDVGHRERRGLDQQPGGVRPVRPGQRERPGSQLGREHPVEMALGVAEPGGEPRDPVALDHTVGDQAHGPRGEVGTDVPVRRAGHGVGLAAAAGAVPALLRGARGGQELDVRSFRSHRRARRPAVDPGRAYCGDELPVEAGVASGDSAVATFLIE